MVGKHRFLVDVNLPKNFSFFNNEAFIHQSDIGSDWEDEKIWQYARENNLVILTRDADFYFKCLVDSRVKVIKFKLGNIRIRELHLFFQMYWTTITDQLDSAQLIQVSASEVKVVIGNQI